MPRGARGRPSRDQYFEIFGNRCIYHKGWTAVTRHSTPWVLAETPALDDDVRELYGPDDWTQARNLAKENPVRNEAGEPYAVEVGRYFDRIDGEIDRWTFSAAPPETRHAYRPSEIPRSAARCRSG